MGDSLASFEVCPNCKQDYQNEVAYVLSRAQVDFVEREFAFAGAEHGFLYINALTCRLVMLDVKNENDRYEGEEVISKMLSTFEAMKRTPVQHGNHLLHPDATITFEGHANANVGTFYHKIGSDDSLRKAKNYFQKARNIFESEGDELGVMTLDNLIENVEAEISGDGRKSLTQAIEAGLELKKFQLFTKEFGADDDTTIKAGVQLALALWKEFRTIKAERLLAKLTVTSRRVHGVEHDCTQFAISAMQRVQVRRVFLRKDDAINEDEVFRAVRYTSDGEKCVVQGPIPNIVYDPRMNPSESSNFGAERTFEVSRADVITSRGTPVVCTGLQKATHLNGKIGDRRDFDEDTGRYTIHFEDEKVKPVKVKPENLRIVFDL